MWGTPAEKGGSVEGPPFSVPLLDGPLLAAAVLDAPVEHASDVEQSLKGSIGRGASHEQCWSDCCRQPRGYRSRSRALILWACDRPHFPRL